MNLNVLTVQSVITVESVGTINVSVKIASRDDYVKMQATAVIAITTTTLTIVLVTKQAKTM